MSEQIIQRTIDNLGRIVIPKPVRLEMGFSEGDTFELYKLGHNSVCWNNISKSDIKEFPLEILIKKVIEKIRVTYGKDKEFICEADGHGYLFDEPKISVSFDDDKVCLKSVSFRYNYSHELVVSNDGIYTVDNAFGIDHDMNYLLKYDSFENFLNL